MIVKYLARIDPSSHIVKNIEVVETSYNILSNESDLLIEYQLIDNPHIGLRWDSTAGTYEQPPWTKGKGQ